MRETPARRHMPATHRLAVLNCVCQFGHDFRVYRGRTGSSGDFDVARYKHRPTGLHSPDPASARETRSEMITPDIIYRIDSSDRIVSIDGPWDAFATTNYTPQLRASGVVGRPLLGFIAGNETRHVYDLLILRARAGQTVTVPFRCDGPGVRRGMELTISSLREGMVEFRARTVQTAARARQPILDPHHPRSRSLMSICSWCKQVEVDGRWMEVEVAVRRLSLFDTGPLPHLTHGMCPTCFDAINREWYRADTDVYRE
jgi:hypothetical protein